MLPLRILTYNIRHYTPTPFKGELPWKDRAQPLINQLRHITHGHADAIVCLQEVFHNQLEDIVAGLNANTSDPWSYIGVGRDDGHQAGEYSPIFYRASQWTPRFTQTIWLSETPAAPSKGWDADSIRLATIAVLHHRATGRNVLAVNTHLDDQGSRARVEGARLILRTVSTCRGGGGEGGLCAESISGVFVAGDMNSEEHQEAYVAFTTEGREGESELVDAAKMVSVSEHHGNRITWTGFGSEVEEPAVLDYVFLGRGWTVDGYAVLANGFDDGVLISDHRPVVVDVRLT